VAPLTSSIKNKSNSATFPRAIGNKKAFLILLFEMVFEVVVKVVLM
jgi:hypothetical protein